MWKVFYIIDGIVKETCENTHTHPVPKAVAESMKKRLSETTHKMGKLVVVSADTKPEQYKLF